MRKIENNMPHSQIQIILKKIDKFPEIKNENVLNSIQKFGTLNLKTEDSYFNSIQEEGPYEYEDGSVYLGNMKGKYRHGRGKLIFKNGAFYEGEI